MDAKVAGLMERKWTSVWDLALRATARQPTREAEVWERGFGKRAGSGSVEWFAPGRVIVLLWLLPPSPLAINAGVQLSLRIGSLLGDTHKCTHTHGHMENINIITNSKQQVMGAATQPRVIQSEHPLTHSPKVIGLGGRVGAASLLATADNWLINVQPMASESESARLQPGDLMKLLSHLDNGHDPLKRTQDVCVCVCVVKVFIGPFASL